MGSGLKRDNPYPKGTALHDCYEFSAAMHDLWDELVKVYQPPLERLTGWLARVFS